MARFNVIQIVCQRRAWLMLLLLGAAGCGGGTGQVSGKVKYKGNALPSGQIAFFDSKDQKVGSASIGSDGSYSATLPAGLVKIAVTTPSSTLRSLPKAKTKEVEEKIKKMKKGAFNPLEGENKDLIPEKAIAIPMKYSNQAESGLSFTVLGGPQTFDIDLRE